MASSGHHVPHTRILLGLILGAVIGSLVNYLTEPPPAPATGIAYAAVLGNAAAHPPQRAAWVVWVVDNLAHPIGAIFLNLLFMAVIPLVFASLAVGVTRLGGGERVGRVGAKTLAYFLITTACAAAVGLTMVNSIQPGKQVPKAQREELMAYYGTEAEQKLEKKADFGVQTLVNVVPRNPLEAFVKQEMLSIIFTALIVGIALTRIDPAKARVIIDVLEGVNQITDFILRLAMALAPVAVFALIFSTTALFGYRLLVALGAFVGTVLAGLGIHLLVVLPILVRVLGGMSPILFFRKVRGVMVTAFSTSSSSATLPASIECAEEDLHIPPGVSRFVLPLSASMNHNGTALFEGVTVMFLAQAFGKDLSLADQIQVLILCVLTATGMAGVPGGSLPLIGLILARFDVPPAGIALVLGVDRFLDMCRTTVNVTADMTTAVFVARTEPGSAAVPAAGTSHAGELSDVASKSPPAEGGAAGTAALPAKSGRDGRAPGSA
jgi:DAACS family dicarboxylate/amino acid:cation (Na+ or H+) symporter